MVVYYINRRAASLRNRSGPVIPISMLDVAPHIQIPLEEFTFTYARSSGPGGQNVNKVNSKAVMRWNPTTSPSLPESVRARFLAQYRSRLTNDGELVMTSERHRDQPSNIEDCYDKVREMLLAVAKAPKKRRPTKPSKASKQRRLDSKKRDSNKKQSRRGWSE